MPLNDYRDEAGDFMKAVNDFDCPAGRILDMLDEEVRLLREAVDDPARCRHKTYDALFLLFELAAIRDFDLDEEWNTCRPRLYAQYLTGRTPKEILAERESCEAEGPAMGPEKG
jgi:hypothetical protein